MTYKEAAAQLSPEDKQYGVREVSREYFVFAMEQTNLQSIQYNMIDRKWGMIVRHIQGKEFTFYTLNGVVLFPVENETE